MFIDTILLCTITALSMLVSPVRDFSPEAALSVFSLVLGRFGELSAGVCVALFAFASVLAWSCYGMDALLYLLPKKGAAEKRIYMAFTALSCFLGCMSPFLGVLNVCDAFNGLMALLNVPALLVLTPQIFAKQMPKSQKRYRFFFDKMLKYKLERKAMNRGTFNGSFSLSLLISKKQRICVSKKRDKEEIL